MAVRQLSRAAVLTLAAALAACTTTSPDVISRQDANRMSSVIDAVVLSVRPVTVEGAQSGVGATAGGIAGAVAGSSIGGYRDGVVGSVLGAVAGAVVGNAIERSATREEAVEIMLQLRSGERRTVVQAKGNEGLKPGDAVIIVTSGGRARVSKAPVMAPPAAPPAPSTTPSTSPSASPSSLRS